MFVDAISHITAANGLLRVDARAVTAPGRQALAGVLLIPLALAPTVVRSLREVVKRAEARRQQSGTDPQIPGGPSPQADDPAGSLPKRAVLEAALAPASERTMLIEEVTSVSVSGGVYRIDCAARAGDGKSRPSGTLVVPGERIMSLIGALETMLEKLPAKDAEADLASIATVGTA